MKRDRILEWAYITYHKAMSGVHQISEGDFNKAKMILERTKININENINYDKFLKEMM